MSAQYPSNVEIHRWAQAQPWGHKVPMTGMGRELVAAWNRAHPDRPYVKSQAYHGTASGYVNRNCRCAPCTAAATAYAADARSAREASA